MNKKRLIRVVGWSLNIVVVLLLVWSIVNYRVLEQDITRAIQVGGIFVAAILIFVLEGAPVFIGPSVTVVALLVIGINPLLVLFLLLGFAILGDIAYYYLGRKSEYRVERFIEKEDMNRYRRLFKKYGKAAMYIMAITPLPYLPTIAGIFKMPPSYFFTKVMGVRMLRHIVVFLFWFMVIGYI